MALPLINGQEYSWSQIEVRIFDTLIAGITAIDYEDEQEMQDNYGAGKYPVSRGYGAIKTKASMTLFSNEVEALQNATPSGRLQDIPEFDVIVNYLPEGGTPITHIINNCRFKKNSRKTKQGDMSIPVELELIASHITWNS